MKTIPFILLAALFVSCSSEPKRVTELKDQKQKVSYSIGLDIGKNLKAQKIEIDAQMLAQGLSDASTGETPLLTDAQAQEVMAQFQKEMQEKKQAEAKVAGEKNIKEGETFLAENKTKSGVVTLPSGLQYKIVKQGNGPKPKPTNQVTVHYSGKLLDGKEFDSSYTRGQPATFCITQVIPGWTEVLQLMPVGSKWEVYIPSNLAYGPNGAGQDIGPNATLIFEMELLGIK